MLLQRLLTHDIFLSISAEQQTCILNLLTLAAGSPYVWLMAKGHYTNNAVVSAVTPDLYNLHCQELGEWKRAKTQMQVMGNLFNKN